jgi:hypothetical protein
MGLKRKLNGGTINPKPDVKAREREKFFCQVLCGSIFDREVL